MDTEVVLASGEIAPANEKDNPDLFWALRGISYNSVGLTVGAGPNFGIVTEFVLKAYKQGDVWSGLIMYTPDKIPIVVEAVQTFLPSAPDNCTMAVGIGCIPRTNVPTIMLAIFYNGAEEEGKAVFESFFDIEAAMTMMETRPMFSR